MFFQQIDYVLTVAEERSFSKAAQRLYMTQPSLSQSILKIEKKLGFKIFDRSTTPLSITKQGEIYIRYAKKAKRIESDFSHEISALSANRALNIMCVSGFIPTATKAAKESKINILLKQLGEKDSPDKLLSGDTDIFIGIKEPLSDELLCRQLCEIPLVLAVPDNAEPDLPLIFAGQTAAPTSPAMLSTVIRANDELSAAMLVKSGVGKAFVTQNTAELLHLNYTAPTDKITLPVYIMYKKNHADERIKKFSECLERTFVK